MKDTPNNELERKCLNRLSTMTARQRNVICALCCTQAFAWYRKLPQHLHSSFAEPWSEALDDLWRVTIEGEHSAGSIALVKLFERMQPKVEGTGAGISEEEFESFDEDPIACTYFALKALCLDDLDAAQLSLDRFFHMVEFMQYTVKGWLEYSLAKSAVSDSDVLSAYHILLPTAMDRVEKEAMTIEQLVVLRSQFS